MSEELFVVLTIPFAVAVGAIFTKFIVLCQQAREEEFQSRRKEVVLASRGEAQRSYLR